MQVNVETGRIKINETEEKCLRKAKLLLSRIAKHGDSDIASQAAEAIALTLGQLAVLDAATDQPTLPGATP